MFVQGLEIEADSIDNAKPEDSRVEPQPKIKPMKVRSIKLVRLSSIRSSSRKERVQFDHPSGFHSSSPGFSGESTPIEFPDASPHYMKATSCSQSHAKDIQSSRMLTRKQSFKRGKSNFVRMHSSTWKKTLTRKQSGGVELKRKLKRSTSIQLAFGQGKCQYQETSPDAESISFSKNQNEKESNSLDSYTTSSGNVPLRTLNRRLSLRPVRIPIRMPTLKSKRTSMGKCSHIFNVQDSNLQRATCSSTIKDSKFQEDQINLHEEPSVLRKVCPYTYCSLHGHRNNASVPPLKRFVSIRRRVLKAQKNCNKDNQPLITSKQTANVKRRSQTRKSLQNRDGVLCEKSCIRKEDPRNLQCDAEVLLGETSYPLINLKECPNQLNEDFKEDAQTSVGFLEIKQTSNENPEVTWNLSAKNDLAIAVKEPFPKTSGPVPDGLLGSLSNEISCRSAVDCETMQEMDAIEDTNDRDSEKDDGRLSSSASKPDLEPRCSGTTNIVDPRQVSDSKYARWWHLIYKHAVSSNQGEGEKLPSDAEENGERIIGSSSSQRNYETDYCVDKENEKAVEIVQKAFDEILLPEIRNFSSGDDSTPRDVASDHDFLHNCHEEDNSEVSEANKSSMKMTFSNSDELHSSQEEKTASSTMPKQSDMKVSKNWSNLKKLLLIKRFVKALESVRSFDPRKPRFLQSDPYPETEKVNLKPLTMDQSKNAEEWMLDFAIRKVISKLAPAQKQRVALLVEAFEAVLPFAEVDTIPRSISAIASEATPDGTIDITSMRYEGKEGIAADNSRADSVDATNFSGIENVNGVEACERDCTADIDAKYHADVNNENIDPPLILNRLVKVLGVNGSNSSSGMSSPLCESTASGKETTEGAETSSRIHNGSTTFQESATKNRFDEAYDSCSGKKNFTRLWYLVYKHMASGVEEKECPISTVDGEYNQDPSDGINSAPVTNGAHDDISLARSQDWFEKEQQIRLHQIEAVKIVEEAIDSIVPDFEEYPPQDQSVLDTDKKNGKKELEEEAGITVETNHEEFDEDSIKAEAVCRNKVESEGKWAESDNLNRKELEENARVKPNQQISRNWSNLKKVILLRRFIKSLEKVRQFKPRGPRFLTMETEQEAEKVQLKHSDIEGRREAEEWMLDYALQRVVSKLTPVRRKKVSLLVEAFETVIPTIKT